MTYYPVYLGRCNHYDNEEIYQVLQAALAIIPLQRQLSGKIVIKPNLVMAHPKIATEGFTRAEVIESILKLIVSRNDKNISIEIVEKAGLGVTTAGMYRWAGYRKLARKYPVKLRSMEESQQSILLLQHSKIHKHITVARSMAERDFLIFAPKLKTNVLVQGYTGALKLNIGSIDSSERLLAHDYRLPQKVVDLLEVFNPDLIVTDGIRFSYGGNQMTQSGMDFGVIAVSTNAVAHDMICAKLIGHDPMQIEHIREAVERGYGPGSLQEIEVMGDFPMEKGISMVKGVDFGYKSVDQFDCNFTVHCGNPYCIAGCQGIFLDWLYMIQDRKPSLLKRFPQLDVVIGKIKKKLKVPKVLLIGDCAQASIGIEAKRIIRIKGCPPTHKRIIWDMMVKLFILAPLVRPSLIIDGFVFYPLKKLKGWLMNLKYRPLKQ